MSDLISYIKELSDKKKEDLERLKNSLNSDVYLMEKIKLKELYRLEDFLFEKFESSYQALLDVSIEYLDKIKMLTSYKINEYLTLELENKATVIYVNGQRFDQCKYLAFSISLSDTKQYANIESIDDMVTNDRSGEYKSLNISPIEEFWGHCSNLQAWVENDYDTRILHSNLAFPLLKKLYEAGDKKAKRSFKEEVIKRLSSNNSNVALFIINQGYLNAFSNDELISLLDILSKSDTTTTDIVKTVFDSYFFPEYKNNTKKLVMLYNKITNTTIRLKIINFLKDLCPVCNDPFVSDQLTIKNGVFKDLKICYKCDVYYVCDFKSAQLITSSLSKLDTFFLFSFTNRGKLIKRINFKEFYNLE